MVAWLTDYYHATFNSLKKVENKYSKIEKQVLRFIKNNRMYHEFLYLCKNRSKIWRCTDNMIKIILNDMFENFIDTIYWNNSGYTHNAIYDLLVTHPLSEKHRGSVIDVKLFDLAGINQKLTVGPKTTQMKVLTVSSRGDFFITEKFTQVPFNRVHKLNGEEFNVNRFKLAMEVSLKRRNLRDFMMKMKKEKIVALFRNKKILDYINKN